MSMLRDVVIEGTGTEAAIPGYTVAGKTGTANKTDPDGRYSTSRYVASFVGLVPATNPRLVIMVMVDEPKGDDLGRRRRRAGLPRDRAVRPAVPRDAAGRSQTNAAADSLTVARAARDASSSLLRRGAGGADPGARARSR